MGKLKMYIFTDKDQQGEMQAIQVRAHNKENAKTKAAQYFSTNSFYEIDTTLDIVLETYIYHFCVTTETHHIFINSLATHEEEAVEIIKDELQREIIKEISIGLIEPNYGQWIGTTIAKLPL